MPLIIERTKNQYLMADHAPGPVSPVGDALVPFTVAGWFYSLNTTQSQTIIWFGDSSLPNAYYHVLAAGSVAGDPVRFNAFWSTNRKANTTTSYVADTWHHFCARAASLSDRSIQLDGRGKGTNTATVSTSNINRTSIGRAMDSTPGVGFDGMIGPIAIWNVALTDSESVRLAMGESPLRIRSQNLIHLYTMDEARIGFDHSRRVRNILDPFAGTWGPVIGGHPGPWDRVLPAAHRFGFSAPTIISGPFDVVAAEVFNAGAVEAEVFNAGAVEAEVFNAGATAAEVVI